MAEFIATAQTLTAGQNVIFSRETKCGNVRHRSDTGIFTLKGSKNCCNPAKYHVWVHVVTTATAATPIQLALAEDGEVLPETLIAIVPVAIGDVTSGDTVKEITVDCDCAKLALRAISATPLTSAILDVSRIS